MERRGCGLGCIIAALGLAVSCCLLPYLVSSLYSVVASVLQVSHAPDWLWGDLLNEVAESGSFFYMLFAEGPICCVGTLALLIVILGAVLVITSLGQREEEEGAEEEYEPYETEEGPYYEVDEPIYGRDYGRYRPNRQGR